MTTIRRIYAYLLTFVGLSMLSVAAVNLLRLVIDTLLRQAPTSDPRYVRDTVAFNVAAALIGLPVWAIHWLWSERAVRNNVDERSSTLRRLYVYAVLTIATLAVAGAADAFLRNTLNLRAATTLAGASLADAADQLPVVGIGLVVWLAHWHTAARDRRVVGEQHGSATLRRWYLYGVAYLGFVGLLAGASQLLEILWHLVTAATAADASSAVATTAVGLSLWLVHWLVLPGRLGADARRDDGTGVLRSVYLFLTLSVGVAGTLYGASQLLYYAVGRLLGVQHPGGVGGDLLQAAAGPASVTIVYAVGWAYQRHALRRQAAAFDEAPRQAGVRRLYTSIVALLSLATLAVGAGGLLWTLGDVLFNPVVANSGDGWRGNVALFSTLALVGLPIWLWHWRPTPAAASEVRSLARRLYVYFSLIAAMLSLIGSAAFVLYRVFGLLLGEASSASVLSDLAHAAGVATVAAVVAIYHWRILRADARRATPVIAESTPTPTPVTPTPTPATIRVELRAADVTAIERALEALRSSGVEVQPIAP